MYSVEIDHDEVKITIVDEEGFYDDVEFLIYDDVVIFRQFDEEIDEYFTIMLSPRMFDHVYKALFSAEGVYVVKPDQRVDLWPKCPICSENT